MSESKELSIVDASAKSAQLEKKPFFSLVSKRRRLKGTVYLLLDQSSSMADGQKLPQLKRGALKFFAESWQRNYAVGIIGFANKAYCLLGATRNFYKFQKRLSLLMPGGRTAMSAAIRLGTWRLKWRKGHKVLFLITDGQPLYKEATLGAAALARAQGIELIVVGTVGADEAFLQALHPKPELIDVPDLAEGVADLVKELPT